MAMLIVEDLSIPYEVRRSTGYRRITLSILEDRVRISAPVNVSVQQLNNLVITKKEWILKHWLAKQDAKKPPVRYMEGEQFLYRGNMVKLTIIRYSGKTIRVCLDDQILMVKLPQDLSMNNYESNIKEALISWYKAQARRVFQEKIDKYAEKMGVTYKTFRLKDQKTSWGSCSSKGNINLNWRIIMAPDPAMDYIIVHELAHLTFLNHSRQFWQRVAEHFPEFIEWKTWFKIHGQELRV